MSRDSFVFYKSFDDAIREIPAEYQLRAYQIIIRYALQGETPADDESWIVKAIFQGARVSIDRAAEAYEAGKRGGRPRKDDCEQIVKTPKRGVFENEKGGFQNQKGGFSNSKTYVYEYDNVSVSDNVSDNVSDSDNKNIKPDSVGSSQETQADKIDYKKIVDYLNEKTGKRFRAKSEATRRLIRARINEGYSEQDFLTVIDNKVRSWRGTKFEQYLQPETLFRASHFDSYLNEQNRQNEFVSGDLPY